MMREKGRMEINVVCKEGGLQLEMQADKVL